MNKSIRFIGLSLIFFSLLMILIEILSLINPADQYFSQLNSIPQFKNSIDSIYKMMLYNRVWTMYSIIYFLFVMVGAILFIKLKKIGRLILEIACWIGIMNAFIDTFFSFILWKNMQTAISNSMTSMGIIGTNTMNQLGFIVIIIGLFLWIVPSLGFLIYLRKSQLKNYLQ